MGQGKYMFNKYNTILKYNTYVIHQTYITKSEIRKKVQFLFWGLYMHISLMWHDMVDKRFPQHKSF